MSTDARKKPRPESGEERKRLNSEAISLQNSFHSKELTLLPRLRAVKQKLSKPGKPWQETLTRNRPERVLRTQWTARRPARSSMNTTSPSESLPNLASCAECFCLVYPALFQYVPLPLSLTPWLY